MQAIKENKSLRKGVNICKGKLAYKSVADALNLDYAPPELQKDYPFLF